MQIEDSDGEPEDDGMDRDVIANQLFENDDVRHRYNLIVKINQFIAS